MNIGDRVTFVHGTTGEESRGTITRFFSPVYPDLIGVQRDDDLEIVIHEDNIIEVDYTLMDRVVLTFNSEAYDE